MERKKKFSAKKQNLQAEIAKKTQKHEKIIQGKKEFDSKKPNLKTEIKKNLKNMKSSLINWLKEKKNLMLKSLNCLKKFGKKFKKKNKYQE